MSAPLVCDLFCGLGGWAEGFLAEGWRVVGFDIEYRPYPGQLVIQDVLTLHGSQLREASLIVASPPCQAYSYRAMPWKRAKALPPPDNTLFNVSFRLQREASDAAGRYIPMVVENVCGAQKWVGPARARFGSYFLWGDVERVGNRILPRRPPVFGHPGLLGVDRKNTGGSWFAVARILLEGKKVGDRNSYRRYGTVSPHSTKGIKQHGSGPEWFDKGIARHGSQTNARKEASAEISKIPYPLARWIAQCFKP